MKVGIDARFYGKEHTGLGRYTINVLHSLAEIDRENSYLVLLRSHYASKVILPSNFQIITCDIPHYSISEQILIPKIIKENKIDIFYTFHLNAPIITNAKLVVTIHDLIKSHFTGKDTTTRTKALYLIKRAGYGFVVNRVVQKAAKIIVPSNFVKKDLLSNFPSVNSKKVIAIHEAPSSLLPPKQAGKIPSKKLSKNNFLLFVGNAYPHKNLKILLDAFSLFIKDKPGIMLAIVSKNNQFLKKILTNKKNIVVLENIEDAELFWLYKNALYTVIPSLMEGFGLVGLESLSLGTPIIASDIEVFREVYKDSATYFNPLDSKDLYTKLKDKSISYPSPKPKFRSWVDVAKDIKKVIYETSTSL